LSDNVINDLSSNEPRADLLDAKEFLEYRNHLKNVAMQQHAPRGIIVSEHSVNEGLRMLRKNAQL
jgi:hypothetical protein